MNDQTTTTDPTTIGYEQARNAIRALGVTDLDDIREVRLRSDKVTVIRWRIEDGHRVHIGGGWLTTESLIPVVLDEQAEAALAGDR